MALKFTPSSWEVSRVGVRVHGGRKMERHVYVRSRCALLTLWRPLYNCKGMQKLLQSPQHNFWWQGGAEGIGLLVIYLRGVPILMYSMVKETNLREVKCTKLNLGWLVWELMSVNMQKFRWEEGWSFSRLCSRFSTTSRWKMTPHSYFLNFLQASTLVPIVLSCIFRCHFASLI